MSKYVRIHIIIALFININPVLTLNISVHKKPWYTDVIGVFSNWIRKRESTPGPHDNHMIELKHLAYNS